ncbi:MAG: hypothetical protein ABUK01_02075 [Leptospirales bacterium]
MEVLFVLVVLFLYMLIHGVIMTILLIKLGDVKNTLAQVEEKIDKLTNQIEK